jgi:hypothetical protein
MSDRHQVRAGCHVIELGENEREEMERVGMFGFAK